MARPPGRGGAVTEADLARHGGRALIGDLLHRVASRAGEITRLLRGSNAADLRQRTFDSAARRYNSGIPSARSSRPAWSMLYKGRLRKAGRP